MAGVAIHRRVRPGQRKAVVVRLDVFDRYAPPAHRMALLAIRAQRALVDVGVAVLALCGDICEYRLHVAVGAGHIDVHAAERVLRLIVIEFGNGADRLPPLRRVAVLAGNVQVAVRTLGRSDPLLSTRREAGQDQQEHCGGS